MSNLDSDIILFRSSLPFHPNGEQVIYVEPDYDKGVNGFIQDNYDWLNREVENLGYEFCYFPAMSERFHGWQYRRYYTPYNPPPITHIGGHAIEPYKLGSDCLSSYLKTGCTLSPSFIIYADDIVSNGYYAFRVFRLDGTNELKSQLSLFFQHFSVLRKKYLDRLCSIRYSVTGEIESYPDNEIADRDFPQEAEKLMEDVREQIMQLRAYGVNEMVLNSLLNPRPRLSTMVISAEGRITLPGYQNREIKMTPLVKAVYFLFLRHPEGIVFKNLPDYREELLMIYKKLTGRMSDTDVLRSIEDVTNPCKNSINEKCARIREAFIREFDDRIARFYYITGSRATAKKIVLSQDYVIWQ